MRQKCAIEHRSSGFVFSRSHEPAFGASIRRCAKIVAAPGTKTTGTQPPTPGILKIKKQIRHRQQHAIPHDQRIDRPLGRTKRRKQHQQSDESGHAQHVPGRIRMRSCEAGQPASHEALIIVEVLPRCVDASTLNAHSRKGWSNENHPHTGGDGGGFDFR